MNPDPLASSGPGGRWPNWLKKSSHARRDAAAHARIRLPTGAGRVRLDRDHRWRDVLRDRHERVVLIDQWLDLLARRLARPSSSRPALWARPRWVKSNEEATIRPPTNAATTGQRSVRESSVQVIWLISMSGGWCAVNLHSHPRICVPSAGQSVTKLCRPDPSGVCCLLLVVYDLEVGFRHVVSLAPRLSAARAPVGPVPAGGTSPDGPDPVAAPCC